MKNFLKSFAIILIILFWFYSTYQVGAGNLLWLKSERSDLVQYLEIQKKILSGPYPLKSEIRVAFLDRLFSLIFSSPDFLKNLDFLAALSFAINELEKEVKVSPNNLFAETELARAYTLLGLKEKAINTMNKAISLSPLRETTLWISFGLLHTLGEDGEAKRTIEFLNQISPTFLNKVQKNE